MSEADLSVGFNSANVVQGITNLDKLAASSRKADEAVSKLNKTTASVGQGFGAGEKASSQLVGILDKMEKSLNDISRASSSIASDMGRVNSSIDNVSRTVGKSSATMDGYTSSINKATAAMVAMGRAANSNNNNPGLRPPSSGGGGGGSTPPVSPWGSWNYNATGSGVPRMGPPGGGSGGTGGVGGGGSNTASPWGQWTPQRSGSGVPMISPQSGQSGNSGVTPYQLQNLGYQLGDIIASGSTVSPTQIMMQQGPQIAQMFMGPNGLSFSALATSAKQFLGSLNPATVAMGGLAAAAGLAILAQNSYAKSQIEVARKVDVGLGRGSGASVSDINRIAEGSATSQLSVGSAREAAAELAGTGKIGGEALTSLMKTMPDFMAMTNQGAKEAAASLGVAFSTGIQGYEGLQKAVGSYSESQLSLLRNLDAQGNRQGAINSLIEIYRSKLVSVNDLTTGWGRLMSGVGTGIAGWWDKFGQGIDKMITGGDLDTQISSAQEKIEEMKNGIVGLPTGFSLKSGFLFGASSKEIDEATAALDKLLAKQNEMKRLRQGEKDDARSQEIGSAIKSIIPDIKAQEDLANNVKLLESEFKNLNITTLLSVEAQNGYALSITRATAARDGFLTVEKSATQQFQLSIDSISAYSAAEKLAAVYAEKHAEVLRDKTKAHMADTEASRAASLEAERYKKAANDALKASEDSLKSAGMLPYTKAMTDLRTQYNRTVDQYGIKDVRSQELANRMKETTTNMIGGPMQQSGLSLNDNIANLKVQRDSLYASAEAAGYMAEKQRLINEYNRLSAGSAEAMLPQIEAMARKYGEVASEAEKFQKISQNIVQGMDEIRSAGRGAFTGLFSDIRQGKDAMASLSTAAGNLADKMFDRLASKPLMDAIFGEDGKAGGGLIGTFTSSIFGSVGGIGNGLKGAGTTATGVMTVNAGSVVVNSGVGGAAGAGSGFGSLIPGSSGSAAAATSPTVVSTPTVVNTSEALSNVTPMPTSVVTSSALPPVGPSQLSLWGFGGNPTPAPGGIVSGSLDPTSREFAPLQKALESKASEIANSIGSAGDTVKESLVDVGNNVTSGGSSLVNDMMSLFKGAGSGASSIGKEVAEVSGAWDTGGYTGQGGKNEVAGVAHRGEVIWSQDDVRRGGGPHIVDSMRRGNLDRVSSNSGDNPALFVLPANNNRSSSNVQVNLIGAPAGTEVKEVQGPNGRRIDVVMNNAIDSRLASSKAAKIAGYNKFN